MIGDPSGKSEERNLLSPEELDANRAGVAAQLSRFLDFGGPDGGRHPGGQRRVAGHDRPARVPPRRRQAVQRQRDDPQGVGPGPAGGAGAEPVVHRVQLHAPAGLGLPAALRPLRLRAAARRQRPVGQHHRGHRPHPPAPGRPGLRAHLAAGHQGRRVEVRQDRVRQRVAGPGAGPARTSSFSSGCARATPRSAPTCAASPSSPGSGSTSWTRPPPPGPSAGQAQRAAGIGGDRHGARRGRGPPGRAGRGASSSPPGIATLDPATLETALADAPTVEVAREPTSTGELTVLDALLQSRSGRLARQRPPAALPGVGVRQRRPGTRRPAPGAGRRPARPLGRAAPGSSSRQCVLAVTGGSA